MTLSADHYDVLQVSRDASQADVKQAFFGLLKEHPPEQKPEEYQRLREAYDVLSNPVARREYDNMAAFGDEIEELREEAEALMGGDSPDFESAVRPLKKAIVLGPEIGILRNMLGHCYRQTDQLRRALRQLGEAVSIDPENEAYRLSKARVLEGLQRHGEAETLYREVWNEDPEDYEAPRALASLLAETDRQAEAHDVLDRAIYADGKIDFQDFFCIYDKLHLYLFAGDFDALEEQLDIVADVAERSADREFAAFMLARTGAELYDAGAAGVAGHFAETAARLDPSNEFVQNLTEAAGEVQEINEAFAEVNEADDLHDFVKHMVGIFAARRTGAFEGEKALFEQRIDEIFEALENVMMADPDNTEVKNSLRTVRRRHPVLFELQEEFFRNVLDHPNARLVADECPHCGDIITAEKSHPQGEGECPHCHRAIRFTGSSFKKPSRRKRSRSRNASRSSSSRQSASQVKQKEGSPFLTILGIIAVIIFLAMICN